MPLPDKKEKILVNTFNYLADRKKLPQMDPPADQNAGENIWEQKPGNVGERSQ